MNVFNMLPVAPTIMVIVVIIAAICACGDPSKRTPIGYANRFLVQQLPDMLLYVLLYCVLRGGLAHWVCTARAAAAVSTLAPPPTSPAPSLPPHYIEMAWSAVAYKR